MKKGQHCISYLLVGLTRERVHLDKCEQLGVLHRHALIAHLCIEERAGETVAVADFADGRLFVHGRRLLLMILIEARLWRASLRGGVEDAVVEELDVVAAEGDAGRGRAAVARVEDVDEVLRGHDKGREARRHGRCGRAHLARLRQVGLGDGYERIDGLRVEVCARHGARRSTHLEHVVEVAAVEAVEGVRRLVAVVAASPHAVVEDVAVRWR